MISYICRKCRTVHETRDADGGTVKECFLCGAQVQVPRLGILVEKPARPARVPLAPPFPPPFPPPLDPSMPPPLPPPLPPLSRQALPCPVLPPQAPPLPALPRRVVRIAVSAAR